MIHTSHPGNIGAAARAMKVMGLSDLCLVNPKSFPDDQANAMSANATDILENAKVVTTLAEAIADCRLVVGSSARHERTLSWDIQDSRECGETIAHYANKAKVALHRFQFTPRDVTEHHRVRLLNFRCHGVRTPTFEWVVQWPIHWLCNSHKTTASSGRLAADIFTGRAARKVERAS